MTINHEPEEPVLTTDQVADFLLDNPGFFIERDDLLIRMELPHNHGQAVSLVEKQVALLRERNRDMRRQLEELINAAKANNEIFNKCERLFLELLDATSSTEFFQALEKSFKRDFRCSAYSLIVFSEQAQQINHFTYTAPISDVREYVGNLMKARNATLGVLRPAEQDYLFRHASDKVKSAAVLTVKTTEPIALLAIGSAEVQYFQANMGTIFINFIANVLARMLPAHLNNDSH
ncbi:MAG: DUF484 family protein [Pseudomonadales bacterium]|nr:DUF484 family protein [Pseudomonadales bacterium]